MVIERVKVRHLHRIKARWYWVPSVSARKLGFRTTPLGADLPAAKVRAQALNAQLDAERGRLAGTAPSREIRTVKALIAAYRTNPKWEDLAPKTKRDYGNILRRIEEKAGLVEVPSITREDVANTYQRLRERHGEAMAAAMMRVWRILLQHATDLGWVDRNPAEKQRLKGIKARTTVWSQDDLTAIVTAAEAAAAASLSLAVLLAYDLGQRQMDVLTLPWAAFDGAAVTLTQAKTGTRVRVPVSDEMAELLAHVRGAAGDGDPIIVSEATGRAYRADHFRHLFARIRAEAGLPKGLQFRDLRRTAATEAGMGGATDDELRSLTGHLSRDVVSVYVQPTGTMAGAAQRKRAAARSER